MCGICGFIFLKHSSPFQVINRAVEGLRHRGYDGCGIAWESDHHPLEVYKTDVTLGDIDVMNEFHSVRDERIFCIAHTRYKTKGVCDISNNQPFVQDSISIVHNGQIESPFGNDQSDTKYLLDTFSTTFLSTEGTINYKIHQACQKIVSSISGAYACLFLISGVGMVALRDSRGIRPLCFARNNSVRNGYAFASESVVFDKVRNITSNSSENFTFVRDVCPAESIFVNMDGVMTCFNNASDSKITRNPCLFEYIYLAHDNSVIDGISIRQAREKMGEWMAPKVHLFAKDSEVIIPIPRTPCGGAKRLAEKLRLPYKELLKIKYTDKRNSRERARTFILSTQDKRRLAIENKFGIDKALISSCEKKHIVLVDDSIVRGNTLKHIIELVRKAVCPSKITVVSLSPPVCSTNKYGIDIPSTRFLIAKDKNTKQIASVLNVDDVLYQDLDVFMHNLKQMSKIEVNGFECSVFEKEKK